MCIPDSLPLEARAEYKRLFTEYEPTRPLSPADLAAIEAYCIAYTAWKQAEITVSNEGQVIRSKTGRVRRHPAVTIALRQKRAMLKAVHIFGHSFVKRDSSSAPFSIN